MTLDAIQMRVGAQSGWFGRRLGCNSEDKEDLWQFLSTGIPCLRKIMMAYIYRAVYEKRNRKPVGYQWYYKNFF
jgi:hypothetical protein